MTMVGSPTSSLMHASMILRLRKEVTSTLLGRVTMLSGVSAGAGMVFKEKGVLMLIVEMWKWGFVEVEAMGSSHFMSLTVDVFGVSFPIGLVGETRVFLPNLVSPFFPKSHPVSKGVIFERNSGTDRGV